jgi:hypothetical protein
LLAEKEKGQGGGCWLNERSGHSLSVALGARVHTSAGGVCHSEAGLGNKKVTTRVHSSGTHPEAPLSRPRS